MTIDLFDKIVLTYGAPLAFVTWVWWQSRGGQKRRDPSTDIMESLEELKIRMTRVETILEERR